jgi:putative transposase
MQTTRTRVYETLQRWAEAGFAGLEDQSHVPHHPHRKLTLEAMLEIRTLQENPELGAFRMSAALEQLGYVLSPASCGRVMALHRRLYGLGRPKPGPSRPKQEMPYRA